MQAHLKANFQSFGFANNLNS